MYISYISYLWWTSVYILFFIFINELTSLTCTHTHKHTHIFIYIYIYNPNYSDYHIYNWLCMCNAHIAKDSRPSAGTTPKEKLNNNHISTFSGHALSDDVIFNCWRDLEKSRRTSCDNTEKTCSLPRLVLMCFYQFTHLTCGEKSCRLNNYLIVGLPGPQNTNKIGASRRITASENESCWNNCTQDRDHKTERD